MAKVKFNEHAKTKSKGAAVEEINRGIEKLKELMAQVEDLSREGFPYRDAVRARTELSLRETIRRVFGEKSEQYHNHKNHKLRTSHRGESAQTIAVLKQLVAQLEEQKSELLGAKPTIGAATGLASPSPANQVATAEARAGVPRETTASSAAQSGTSPSPMAPVTGPHTGAVSKQSEHGVLENSRQAEPAPLAGIAPLEAPPTISARHNASPPGLGGPTSAPSASEPTTITSSSQYETGTASPMALPGSPKPPSNLAPSMAAATALPATGSVQAAPPLTAPPETARPTEATVDHDNRSWSDTPAHDRPAAFDIDAASVRPSAKDPYSTTQSPQSGALAGDQGISRPENSSTVLSQSARSLRDLSPLPDDPLPALRKICTRFHLVARQLRLRRDYRATLEVEDEYDVQDLLYALLRLEFEEVGSEDWCPEYAEGATRTSYLLHKERVVIVAKKTKPGVTARELTEQVRIDSRHYSGRADCRTLVCFIYDPEGRVGNPRGLESDLTMVSDTSTIEVIIAPK